MAVKMILRLFTNGLNETMKKISSLHKNWMKDEAYRKEYAALEAELGSASADASPTHLSMVGLRPDQPDFALGKVWVIGSRPMMEGL